MSLINVNKAGERELMTVRGIGKATAGRIVSLRDSGVRINSLNELVRVAQINSQYHDHIREAVDFGDGSSGNDTAVLPPLERSEGTSVLDELPAYAEILFSFKLRLDEPQAEKSNYRGYQAEVKFRTHRSFGTGFLQHIREFNPDGTLRIVLSRGEYIGLADKNFIIVVRQPNRKILLERTEYVENGDEIVLSPVVPEKEAAVQLIAEKQDGEDYNGFELRWTLHLRRGQSRFTRSGKLELSRENEVRLVAETQETIEEVEASVRTADDNEILSRSVSYDTLQVNGPPTLRLTLPAPNTERYNVLLVESVDVVTNPYADHSLVVIFDVLEPDTLNILWRDEQTFPIQADGTANVRLKHYGLVRHLELQVRAPTGEVLSRRAGSVDELGELDPIEIRVPPREVIQDLEAFVRLPRRPDKALCRLVDPSGQSVYSDVQVIFYTTTVENPDSDSDFGPTIVARSENNGYFVIELPHEPYTAAFARVGVAQEPHAYIDVPIRLDEAPVVRIVDDEVVEETRGFLPGKILIVVESDAASGGECDCETCSEVDFYKVRPVLEEFSYYTVVRTTEPAIQGYTLEEDGVMTVQEILDIVPMTDQRGSTSESLPPAYLESTVRKDILLQHINRKKGLTVNTLQKAIEQSNALKLRQTIVPQRQVRAYGRQVLNLESAIDWDEDPTIYQATSLAHGHLLHFKQEWISDGYSLGDLVYSLPLAPGQKKQIVVLDWEARAAATRTEALDYRESLANNLSRDRDVNEIVRGALDESTRGGSVARTSSFGAGLGIGGIGPGFGGLLGVAGGSSKASSSAWQDSARTTTLSSAQSLRDRTSQAASSVRSQRGTVVETAIEGEQFSVQTEVVANYNHCHSLTIQYFEVLRHLRVEQRLSGVQECLFVPLMLSPFDFQKILRWRESLEPALPGGFFTRLFGAHRGLRAGFDAIERIENDYEGSDLPEKRYADEDIEHLEGDLQIEFRIGPPTDIAAAESREDLRLALSRLTFLIPGLLRHLDAFLEADMEARHELFMEHVAPELAAALVENLRVYAVRGGGRVRLPLDATLTSRFRPNRSLYVSLRQEGALPSGLQRTRIAAIELSKASEITLSDGSTLSERMPVTSSVVVRSGSLRYRTKYASGHLFRDSHIADDLIGYGAGTDRVRVATPLSRQELRNPRYDDLEKANALQDHLNDNLERYHQAIWIRMSPERRFMFLDGIQVTDYSERARYPAGVVRSVASVVENKVVGVVGNSLVMPVAPGFRLDPSTRGEEIDLLSLYRPPTPMEPIRLSLPTKGVFAEAVMGRCNACERIQEDRFWRWGDEPIPDQPTSILPVSTEERRGELPDATPTPFPTPIINLQNAPAAPDLQGFAAAAQILGNPGLFRDITGLTENQRNAINALQSSLSAAQNFGNQAAQLTALGAKLKAISDARKESLISEEQAGELAEKAFNESITSGTSAPPARGSVASGVTDELNRLDRGSDHTKLRVERDGDREVVEYERSGRSSDQGNGSAGRGGGTGSGDGTSTSAPPSLRPAQDDEERIEELAEEAEPYNLSEVPGFGPDTLAQQRPALALLTAYLSQYEGDDRVPKMADALFNRGKMQGVAQQLKYAHINAALQDGPKSVSWVVDEARGIASSALSAYLAVHNHLRTLGVGGLYEEMALPWKRLDKEGTLERAIYLSRTYFDESNEQFEDSRITFPRGSLSEEAFFNGKTPDGTNASGFFALNLFEDEPFAALRREGFGTDHSDRYHYCLALTVVEAITSGSVSETTSVADLATALQRLISSDVATAVTEVKALAYAIGIHTAVVWLSTRLQDTLLLPQGMRARPEVRAWYYMNALSFLEGANYGSDYTDDLQLAQEDIRRESRVHLHGVLEVLRRHGADTASLQWVVPIPDLYASELKGVVFDLALEVVSQARSALGEGLAGLPRVLSLLTDLPERFETDFEQLHEPLWPYVYEVLDHEFFVVTPYALEADRADIDDLDGATGAIRPGEAGFDELREVRGAHVVGGRALLAQPALADKLEELGRWWQSNFPGQALIVEEAWADVDESGTEHLDALHWEGRAALVRSQDGDPAKLPRLAQLASLLFSVARAGLFTTRAGQQQALVQVAVQSDEAGDSLVQPTIDVAAAVSSNSEQAAALGWDTAIESIRAYFNLEEGADDALALSVADFQRRNGFPPSQITGVLNASTWTLLESEIFRTPPRSSQVGSEPVYHVVSAHAYLRDEQNSAAVLVGSDGARLIADQDRLVLVAETRQAVVEDREQEIALAVDPDTRNSIGWTLLSNLSYFYRHNIPEQQALEPVTTLAPEGLSGTERRIAEEYNAVGGLLTEVVSRTTAGDAVTHILAVLLSIVVKEGRRFVVDDAVDPARPVTRFENHVFYSHWIESPLRKKRITETEAEQRRQAYDNHFKPRSGWRNHKICPSGTCTNSAWQSLHVGSVTGRAFADLQHEAIRLAERISSEELAYMSASYGGSQIVGAHYRDECGFVTPKAMYEAFFSTRAQTLALCDYASHKTHKGLTLFEWVQDPQFGSSDVWASIARLYNGDGRSPDASVPPNQKEPYAKGLRRNYNQAIKMLQGL